LTNEGGDRFLVISRYSQFYFAPPIRNQLYGPILTGHISKII